MRFAQILATPLFALAAMQGVSSTALSAEDPLLDRMRAGAQALNALDSVANDAPDGWTIETLKEGGFRAERISGARIETLTLGVWRTKPRYMRSFRDYSRATYVSDSKGVVMAETTGGGASAHAAEDAPFLLALASFQIAAKALPEKGKTFPEQVAGYFPAKTEVTAQSVEGKTCYVLQKPDDLSVRYCPQPEGWSAERRYSVALELIWASFVLAYPAPETPLLMASSKNDIALKRRAEGLYPTVSLALYPPPPPEAQAALPIARAQVRIKKTAGEPPLKLEYR